MSDHADGKPPSAGICARVWTVPICVSILILLTSLLFAIVAKKLVVSPIQKGFDLLFDQKR